MGSNSRSSPPPIASEERAGLVSIGLQQFRGPKTIRAGLGNPDGNSDTGLLINKKPGDDPAEPDEILLGVDPGEAPGYQAAFQVRGDRTTLVERLAMTTTFIENPIDPEDEDALPIGNITDNNMMGVAAIAIGESEVVITNDKVGFMDMILITPLGGAAATAALWAKPPTEDGTGSFSVTFENDGPLASSPLFFQWAIIKRNQIAP